MVPNLTTHDIYNSIVNDFKGAWNSIAANSDPMIGRANFMFARQAMNLLEFAAMLCDTDPSRATIRDFSTELKNIEVKYFTQLPGKYPHPGDFILPHRSSSNETFLLAVLYDLIRHGLAHQYQQIVVTLADEKHFYVSLTGADHGQYLNTFKNQRPSKHLAYTIDNDGDVKLVVYPQVLFLDFEKAIEEAQILKRNLHFPYLYRPSSKWSPKYKGSGGYYHFATKSLEDSLAAGNHVKF
jgi:hypothetical protein